CARPQALVVKEDHRDGARTRKTAEGARKKLRKSEKAKSSLGSLSDATALLLTLDVGMLDGAVLPKERRESLALALLAFARNCFASAVRLDPAASSRWISQLPVSSARSPCIFRGKLSFACGRCIREPSKSSRRTSDPSVRAGFCSPRPADRNRVR